MCSICSGFAQQRVVAQVDHPHRQVVAGAPPGVDAAQFVGGERIVRRCLRSCGFSHVDVSSAQGCVCSGRSEPGARADADAIVRAPARPGQACVIDRMRDRRVQPDSRFRPRRRRHAIVSAVLGPTPAGRRGAAPAPECAGEGTGVGIVQRHGDPARVHLRFSEPLPGDLETALVYEFLKAGAEGIQAAIQRAAVQGEEPRDPARLGLMSGNVQRECAPCGLLRGLPTTCEP